MKRKVLITGTSGFIGRNLKERLAEKHEVFAPNHAELELLDEESVARYLDKNKFDVVIHAATHDASRNSKKDPRFILPNNLHMFFNLVKRNDLFGKMAYFGSGAEYDNRYYQPRMKEEYFGTHIPADDYGFSKYVMAKYIDLLPNVYDFRIFGCFGKYEDWQIRFISNAICKTIFDLPITMRQDVFFSYLYINDLVKIISWFIEQKELQHRHYNIIPDKPIDLLSIAKTVLQISDKDLPINIAQEGLKPEYTGDNRRLLAELGEFQFTPIDQAIAELYTWYHDNRQLIKKELLLSDK